MSNLRTAVLDFVTRPDYKPAKPAVIAKKLGLENDAVRELKKVVKQLVKSGELAWGPSHLVFAGTNSAGEKMARESGEERA